MRTGSARNGQSLMPLAGVTHPRFASARNMSKPATEAKDQTVQLSYREECRAQAGRESLRLLGSPLDEGPPRGVTTFRRVGGDYPCPLAERQRKNQKKAPELRLGARVSRELGKTTLH